MLPPPFPRFENQADKSKRKGKSERLSRSPSVGKSKRKEKTERYRVQDEESDDEKESKRYDELDFSTKSKYKSRSHKKYETSSGSSPESDSSPYHSNSRSRLIVKSKRKGKYERLSRSPSMEKSKRKEKSKHYRDKDEESVDEKESKYNGKLDFSTKSKYKSKSHKKYETSSESENSQSDEEETFYAKSKSSRIPRDTMEWLESSGGRLPKRAVCGGYDINGEKMYVGRIRLGKHVIPGKIVPSHKSCYASFSGKEIFDYNYEVLTASNDCELVWLSSREGKVPIGAVNGGHEENGDVYYIGRAEYGGSLIIGKVDPAHKTLYLPFGGKEISTYVYEVLCVRK